MTLAEKKAIDVRTELYRAHFEILPGSLLCMRKRLTRSETRQDIDVFADRWQIYRSIVPKGQISLRYQGGAFEAEGPSVLFIPPFSILDWTVGAGEMDFECFQSSVSLPEYIPRIPFLLKPRRLEPILSMTDVLKLLKETKPAKFFAPERTRSPLARRIKRILDRSYLEKVSLGALLEQSGSSPATASRSFHQCYGITPLDYRNRLRTDTSMMLLQMRGIAVRAAADAGGFSSLNRFHAQFRRLHFASPSRFVLRPVSDKPDPTLVNAAPRH